MPAGSYMMMDGSVPENGKAAAPSRMERQISEREGVRLMNPHIQTMQEDVLYHLALGSGSHDLEQMFGDVRFICMGGTPQVCNVQGWPDPFDIPWNGDSVCWNSPA